MFTTSQCLSKLNSMSKLKLLYNTLSPPCRFVLMVADSINLKLDLQEVDILSKKYLSVITQINPQHTIPTLQDSNLTIWESHAIAPYLITKYAEDDGLYPSDPKIRAVIDQRLHFDSGVLYPILRKIVEPILFKNRFGISRENIKSVETAYGFCDHFVQRGKWLCGQRMCLADLSCVATLSTLDLLYPINERRHKKLYSYLKRWDAVPVYEKSNVPGLDKLAAEIHARILYCSKHKTRGSNTV